MKYNGNVSLHTEYTDAPFHTIPTNQVPILKSLFSMIEKQINFRWISLVNDLSQLKKVSIFAISQQLVT